MFDDYSLFGGVPPSAVSTARPSLMAKVANEIYKLRKSGQDAVLAGVAVATKEFRTVIERQMASNYTSAQINKAVLEMSCELNRRLSELYQAEVRKL